MSYKIAGIGVQGLQFSTRLSERVYEEEKKEPNSEILVTVHKETVGVLGTGVSSQGLRSAGKAVGACPLTIKKRNLTSFEE